MTLVALFSVLLCPLLPLQEVLKEMKVAADNWVIPETKRAAALAATVWVQVLP